MKNIVLILLCLCATSFIGGAQTFNSKNAPNAVSGPTRGVYGNMQSYTSQTGVICAIRSNTVTPLASGVLDTLTNVDTGYVQFVFPSQLGFLYDFAVTKITGTVAGQAFLYGSIDNATWHIIRGDTTRCVDCVGYAATVTNTAGTKHYQWVVPANTAPVYPFYQVGWTTAGTMTASYSGTAKYKY